MPIADWSEQWSETVATVDAALSAPLTQETCETTLGYLREQRVDLEPTPLVDLEAPVRSWFDLAEDITFECELRDDDRLGVLESEVELVLSAEG